MQRAQGIRMAYRDPEKRRAWERRWREANREKLAARARRYWEENREENREKLRERARHYFAAHTDQQRARIQNRAAKDRGAGIVDLMTPGDLARMRRGQDNRCAAPWCRKLLSDGPWEIDHLMPLCRGGKHERGNWQLLCRACSKMKHRKHPDEWCRQGANQTRRRGRVKA